MIDLVTIKAVKIHGSLPYDPHRGFLSCMRAVFEEFADDWWLPQAGPAT